MYTHSPLPGATTSVALFPTTAAERPSLQPLLRHALPLVLLLTGGIIAVALIPHHLVVGIAAYASFHAIIEMVAIVVAMLIFATGWVRTGYPQPASSVLLAGAFLAVGLLDLLHMRSYEGMPALILPADPEKAIFFWLVARLLSALALLQFTLLSYDRIAGPHLRSVTLAVSLGLVGLTAWVGLWHNDWLPRTFIPGYGLTPFKVAAEYLIVGLLLGATGALLVRRRLPTPFHLPILLEALLTLTFSEICFTLYNQVTDGFNLLGHVYKALANFLLYRSIFVSTIREPYRVLTATHAQLTREHAALLASEAHLRALAGSLAQAEARFRAAMDGSLDAFMTLCCVRDAQGRIVDLVTTDLNQRAAARIGRPRAELIGLSLRQAPAFAAAVHRLETFVAVIETGVTHTSVVTMERPDGRTIWIEQQVVPLDDGVAVSFRDVTERQCMEQILRDREETYRGFVEQSSQGLLLTDEQGQIIEFNAALAQQTGLERAKALGLPIWELQVRLALPELRTPENIARVRAGFEAVLASGTAPQLGHEIEMQFLRPDGSTRVVLQNLFAIHTSRGFRLGGISRDITERHAMEHALRTANDQIQQLATTDGLTGLYNHRTFQERMATLVHNPAAHPLALILLDIDHFKRFNDTYGHPAGDAVLRTVAELLRGAVRTGDLVARYGGEEFAVLLPATTTAAARVIAERCRLALARHTWPLTPVTISVGVAALNRVVRTAEQLLAAADTALYKAKRAGRNCVVVV